MITATASGYKKGHNRVSKFWSGHRDFSHFFDEDWILTKARFTLPRVQRQQRCKSDPLIRRLHILDMQEGQDFQ